MESVKAHTNLQVLSGLKPVNTQQAYVEPQNNSGTLWLDKSMLANNTPPVLGLSPSSYDLN